jgi:long-chain acyl-CoA synthetase
MCVVLPFDYCFGASLLHTHLRAGGSLVLSSSLFLEDMLDDVERYHCTGIAGVPSLYQRLIRQSSFGRRVWPHLRYLQQAGGRLPEPYIEEYLRALPNHAQLYVMYGQTEATARLSYLPPERLPDKIGSIGKPVPGVALSILDGEGHCVPNWVVGEIVAAGESVTLGYWLDEKSRKIFNNGWLHTGDIGYVDGEGFIFIVGRESDFIKPNGHRISCAQIESVISEAADVIEVAVLGVPHSELGEGAKAFVVTKAGSKFGPNEIIAHCKKRLPAFAVPCEVEIVEEIPKNASGKMLKRLLGDTANSVKSPCPFSQIQKQ